MSLPGALNVLPNVQQHRQSQPFVGLNSGLQLQPSTAKYGSIMFRASPWVPYQPTPSHPSTTNNTMDDDVDMDAPLISTLPEEKTPPPRSKAAAPRKSKPKQAKSTAVEFLRRAPAAAAATSDDDEPLEEAEEEEDQLIDDEDDVTNPVPIPSVSAKISEPTPKKKAPAKRKPRKEPGTEEEGGKKRTKKEKISHPVLSVASTPSRTPTAPGIEATSSESHDDGNNTGANTPSISVVESEPQEATTISKGSRKKAAPRKPAVSPKTNKSKPSKYVLLLICYPITCRMSAQRSLFGRLKMVIPALSAIVADDAASVMSEGGSYFLFQTIRCYELTNIVLSCIWHCCFISRDCQL